jgi:hypothetical protein
MIAIGPGFEASGPFLIILGVVPILLAIFPKGVQFSVAFPTPWRVVKKPIPRLVGQLIYFAAGILLIWWGIVRWVQ